MSLSKITGVGNYQLFDNITSLPSEMMKTLKDIRVSAQESQSAFSSINDVTAKISAFGDLSNEKIEKLSLFIDKLLEIPSNDKMSFSVILDSIKKHPVGLMANVVSMMRAHDLTAFITQLVSMLSLLGFEGPVIESIRSRWENIDISSQRTTGRFESYDKLPKVLCLLITILGPMVGGTTTADLAGYIRRTKKDAEIYKSLIEELEDLAEENGFGFSSRAKFVHQVKEEFNECVLHLADFEKYLNVSPIRFCRKDTYEKYLSVGKKIQEFIKNLATKSYSDFIGTTLGAEMRILHQRYNLIAQNVERIRRTNAERVKPVGVCLLGSESQIGKSHMMTQIEKLVKLEMQRRYNNATKMDDGITPEDPVYQAFGDIAEWSTWNQNLRDKYDQNYQGQQIHAIDDAFSSKDELEHQPLINFISNRPVPSYQAELNAKGIAYECRLVMVSCNNFPRDSKTIKNIHALAERFPIFVHVVKKPKAVIPESGFDTSFDWLELHLSTGSNFFNKKGRRCTKEPPCFGGNHDDFDKNVKISDIVMYICDMLYTNQERHDQVQESMNDGKFETEEQFFDAKAEEPGRTLLLSQHPELITGLDLLNIPNQKQYSNWEDLPSEVSRGLKSSLNPESFSGRGAMVSSHGRSFVDLVSVSHMDFEHVLFMYKKYGFKPIPKYYRTIDLFLRETMWFGPDYKYLVHNGVVYKNDCITYQTEDCKGDYEAYTQEHCPTWYTLLKLFGDTEYLVLGACFSGLMFLGLPAIVTLPLMLMAITYYKLDKTKDDDVNVSIIAATMQKLFVIFGLWITAKILVFICRRVKGLLNHTIWRDHPQEAKIAVGTYENSSVSFIRGNLKIAPKDNTIKLVTESGKNDYDYCGPLAMGEVRTVMWRNAVKIHLICCIRKEKLDISALARALNNLEVPAVYIRVDEVTEEVRTCLEENGGYAKFIVYQASTNTNAYFGTSLPPRARAQAMKFQDYEYSTPPVNVERLMSMFDEENPNATQEYRQQAEKLYKQLDAKNRALNVALKKVPGHYEESGQRERDRRPQVQVRSYARAEESGTRERNRKQPAVVRSYRKQYETYDGTSWRNQTYEAKSVAKTKFLADCSGKEVESEFSENDYNPTEPELDEIRFEDCKENTIGLEADYAIRYPTIAAMSINAAETRIATNRFETAVDPNANALLASIRKNYLVKLMNVKTGASLYGTGIGNHVIFPSHLVAGVGDLVTIRRMDGLVPCKETFLGRVSVFKREWESAALRVCLPSDPSCKAVEGISKHALTFKVGIRHHVPLDCDVGAQSYVKYTLQYLPNQGMIIPSMAQYIKKYEGTLSGTKVSTSIYAMRTLPFMNAQTVPGDCGGAVVMLNAKSSRKLLGLHIGSATNAVTGEFSSSYGLVAILTQERIDVLTENAYVNDGELQSTTEIEFTHNSKYDSFEELYQSPDTFGTHMPQGDETAFKYLGDMFTRQIPCDLYGRTDHHSTPFTGVFPVRKVPSALIESQVKDTSLLKLDSEGRPSIIVTQMEGYGDKPYTIDQTVMDDMVEQFTDYMEIVLEGSGITTARNHKTAMYEAINGQSWNDHFDKINDKTSPGIPWSNYASKKIHFLEPVRIIDPYRTSSEEKFVLGNYLKRTAEGEMLHKVFITKLTAAKNLKRTVSIWKVCLKDEVRDIEKVEIGKTRAFIAPPMESFLMGRYLFGRWKAAFKAAQFSLFHAIGIDMKSLDVTRLAEKLQEHPNFIDMDYKNYDQRLLAQFMEAAGKIIAQTIRRRDQRLMSEEQVQQMYNARIVYFDEVIRTILCANKTVFLTSHGNKSGNPLTTEMNCIVNVLYSWYVFRKVTGMTTLQEYRKHVVDINFGDDKVLSISDEVIEKFNFCTYKAVMAELGQIVTSGTKSEIEVKCTRNIEEISFLKRELVNINASIWIARLDQRSIESMFNYSSLNEEEVEEWKSAIMEQQIEAMLWGREYYMYFMRQLRGRIMTRRFGIEYPQLKDSIIENMLLKFDHVVTQYFVRIGLLDPETLTKETITYENGKVIYSSGKAGIKTDTSYIGKYESEQIKNAKKINFITPSEDSVMETIKSAIQYVGSASRTLKLRQGNACPEEMAPEGPAQYQKVQSDVGPPIQISCSDGLVMAFPLAQSDDFTVKGFEIPRAAQKQYSLPDELKHFTENEVFSLTDVSPVHVMSPKLREIAPKAANIGELFAYGRSKMTIMCLNCRPPMGFAQTIKVAITAPDSTDETVINRKGVTYDLADNPKMYFIIPYCDRAFMESQNQPWFKVIIQQITSPVAAENVPDPLYIRPSFEVHHRDYYVHQLPNRVDSTFTGETEVILLEESGASQYVISVPRRMYLCVSNSGWIEAAGTATVTTPVGTLLLAYNTDSGTKNVHNSTNQLYTPGLYRISCDIPSPIEFKITWTALSDTPPSIIISPVARRAPRQRKDPIKKESPRRVHIRAAEVLEHPTDAKFEQMYWNSKGKRGFTLPGHNYEGPGNSLNNGEPTTETDAYARKHDLQYAWASYLKSQGKLNEQAFEAKIHAADEELARNSNMTSLDGISAWAGMRAKMFVEHFTGLLYPSVGQYQAYVPKEINYVQLLKQKADRKQIDVQYIFNRQKSPEHAPIYECICIYGEGEDRREVNTYGIGKKDAKQSAAELMLSVGRFESDFDSAAAEPSVSMDTRPPVAQGKVTSSLAMGQTVGNSVANIGVVQDNFIPINTYEIASATPQIFKMRIAPGNFTSNGSESQAQQPFRNHLFSGPVQSGNDLVYCTFKITTAANFQQNARVIVAHIPITYSAAEVAALSAFDLKQFPNREHKLHGTETIFSPQWINKFPVIYNHGVGATNTNGWLVCNILEDSLSTTSTAPRLTLWVCSNRVAQSFGVTPALPQPIIT